MKHNFVKITARITLFLIFILLILCIVSCGSTKTKKSEIKEVKTNTKELALKKHADSIRVKDSLAIVEKIKKEKTEIDKTEVNTNTKIELTPEKDPITGQIKPSKYTEKINGKITTEITIDGNGKVTVETNKKNTNEKHETQSEIKETNQIKTKDSTSANKEFNIAEKQKEELDRLEREKVKKSYTPFFFTWWFWLLVIILLFVLWYLSKKFKLPLKIKDLIS